MAPGDVCHGPRCSLAGLGPTALEYRSCHWPGGSAGSPQCVRPMGCWFFPVPRPPYVCAASWASRLLFTGAPARCVVLRVRRPGPPGSCSPVCPLGVLCCVCGVLGLPAPDHRCARSVCCVACAASWASRLLFTGVPARCVVLRVRCPGPPGSCSPVCPLGVLFCVCGVLGLLAPVHRCARSVCCVACAVSWASRLLFTVVPARCVVLRVRCPGPPGSCSPVCPLGVLFCVCGVLGLPAPVHRCARSVCCVACAASWASRLLFTGVPARCVVLPVRCPGPPGSCSPVCPLAVLFCVCGVLGLPAPVHRCARSVCCVACAVSWTSRLLFTGVPLGVLCCVCGVLGLPAPVHLCARSVCCFACAASWASRLLFTGAPARCVVLRVRWPGPPGSCSPVCPLGVLCCVCGVLGLPAPVHLCARSGCCFACAASWASRLLFTGAPARCVVLRVRRPGPPGSCSPVCPLGVLCCVCGVLGLPAPVHLCARSVCCFACAASWASRLLFTGAPARCVVLRVRCPGPPGSCSPVCPLVVLCCVCGVLGLPAPVHLCARSVCYFACAASWASRLLFTGAPARCVVLRVRRPGPPGSCSPVRPLGVLCCVCGVLGLPAPVHRCAARCVVLRVRCPGPPGSCSPVCPLGVLFCVCGVLGLPAPVHRCARSVCCVACAVAWASRLLFTGVPTPCVVLRVRCPGPPGSCSPVCPLGLLFCVCGVLGLPAPVHRCARSVCCAACAASWASRLLFTGVPARCVVLRVRCPGPPGSCSPVCPLRVLFCVCGVLGLPAPVHRCARSVCCVACAVSWASRLLFTGVPARCVVLRVRCPGSPGSCSPVCPLGVLCCVCGVLGLPAPVHLCARSVCCFACAASWASRLLFTGVPLGVLCCVCGVLGLPAPVHLCARSVCCFACAASWASRLLFTGAPARCVVLCVRRPGPPGSCSPVCPLGVLFCVCGVLGLLAPVHRCARSVCCVAVRGVAAGRSLVHPDGGYRSRQGLCTLRAHTRPSGRRLFVAGRGWVPSGRALVHPDGGWRACACSLWPGRAGRPPGRVVVRLTFSFGRFVFLLCLAPSGLGLPPSLSLPLPFLVALALCFGCFSRSPAAWLFVRSRLVCVPRWLLFGGFSPPPSLFVSRGFRRPFAWCFGVVVFFFFLLLPPCAPPVSGFLWFPAPVALGLGAVRCFLCWPSASRLSVRLSLFRAFRLAGRCSPPPLFVSRFSSLLLGALVLLFCFFFFSFFPCAPPLSPAFSGFRPRVPWASALCVVCFVGLPPLGSPCACPSFVLSAWLVVAPPPPPFFSRGSRRCRSVLCAVCCASLGAVLRRAAARCVLRCCAVLCSLGAASCCAVLPGAARCPGPCALRCCVLRCCPVLCVFCRGAVVRAVVHRSALFCVCPGVLCRAFPVLSALCGAVLRCAGALALCCSCGVVWCCGVPWCGAGAGGPWLSAGGVFRCRCRCLAAVSVPLWLVWFAVVPCFPVSCSVVLCCRVVPCCCALLSCCGAVGACHALLWAVVLRCVVLLVGCAVFCPVVVSACCGALFLVLCVPCLLRSVRCGALLCWLWCPASLCRVLWRCAGAGASVVCAVVAGVVVPT